MAAGKIGPGSAESSAGAAASVNAGDAPVPPSFNHYLTTILKRVGLGDKQARTVQYLLLLGAIGILLLTSGDWLGKSEQKRPSAPARIVSGGADSPQAVAAGGGTGAVGDSGDELGALEMRMARDLVTILGQVYGAGRVTATVKLESGPVQVLATDAKRQSRTVQEKDNGGGTRTTTDQDESMATVVMRAPDGDAPLVLRQERPKVAGVLVVAEGAADRQVRSNLTSAAAAALGVYPHRVTVVPMAGK